MSIDTRIRSKARLAAALLLVWPTGAIGRQAVEPRGVTNETRELVRRAVASTGLILVRASTDSPFQNPRPKGSAVVVRSDGIAVTNVHVITEQKTGRFYDEILFDLPAAPESPMPGRYRLKPVFLNREYDLALLKIESDAVGTPVPKSTSFPTVQIGDSKSVQLLDDLFIIGFPDKGGSTVTVNHGVVEGKDTIGNWIKTDARVIHGNSGGAAVNSEGKLIGIPTKVVADEQPIDKNGDGIPDEYKRLGAVGFLRPAHLVAAMLARLDDTAADKQLEPAIPTTSVPVAPTMKPAERVNGVSVRGVVRSTSGRPIAGAIVGILAAGAASISETSLLAWGGANPDGRFSMNKPVPPGKYSVKVKALGYEPYERDIDIAANQPDVIIILRAASPR
jgi:S1-C subfamily serine protease